MKLRVAFSLVAALVLGASLAGLTSRPQPAAAHPLGNFTINALARVQLLGLGDVQLRYVLDIAEIPAFQELRAIDRDGDGLVSDAEAAAYLDRKVPELIRNLDLRIGGQRIALSPTARDLSFPEGQGGLATMRLTLDLSGAQVDGWQSGTAASLRDTNYPGRIGWRQIVITGGEDVAITETTAPSTDDTAELTVYPSSRLQSPPDVREARFRFEAGSGFIAPAATVTTPASEARPGRSLDGFAGLISQQRLTPAFVALSLLAAAFWGAAHALGPGHGKTIVASYLVGSQGTAWHAALLGLVVTLTHTSSVIAVGLVTLFAAPLLPAEDLYVWLSVISGLMVVIVAATLFATRLRSIRRGDAFFSARPRKQTHGRRPHVHTDGEQDHGHSHEVNAPGLRGLIALGISGGLLPCPTALIVMLGAIALDRTVYGLALVLAFGVGLSVVLTGIGLILVYANRLLTRASRFSLLRRSSVKRIMVTAPLFGSLVMFVAGLVLTGRALSGVL